MKRVTLSLPDELADDLIAISDGFGVSKSAFLSAYLSRKVHRLRLISAEYEHLSGDAKGSRRNRGISGQAIMEMAEFIVDEEERLSEE